ncbi:MAG: DUF4831 family protein [Bacteroidales bacterium]|nr:DUF4831 family protein [Bacteroidales bacterium]
MRKIVTIILVFLVSFSYAQINTQKVEPSEVISSAKGLVYGLPKVVLRLDVWIEKTEYLKGPYSSYSKRLLGLSEIIESNYSSYQIRQVKISTEYLPDSEQLYVMNLGEITGKMEGQRFIQMSESGLFMGVSQEDGNQLLSEKKILIEKTSKGNRDFSYYADANLIEKVDTIIRRVDVDTATIEKAILKHSTIEKDMAQRAQDAATYYMEIHKNRVELISGFQEVAYDPGTMALMNNELKQMEDDYLALFAGKKLNNDEHYVFYYSPAADQPNIIAPVFKFSESSGLNYLSASGGEKVSIAIKSNGLAQNLMNIELTAPVNGVVYRFPETAEVWVKYGAKEYDKQMILIPQLGRLQSLQMEQNVFELHPSSGGLKVLELRN